jgi:hypothetical protein
MCAVSDAHAVVIAANVFPQQQIRLLTCILRFFEKAADKQLACSTENSNDHVAG